MTSDAHPPKNLKGTATACARKLRVLADGTRLAVLRALMGRSMHVHELSAKLKVEQSLLSHHLRTLRDTGLVVVERDGKQMLYRIAPSVTLKGRMGALDLGCCFLSFD